MRLVRASKRRRHGGGHRLAWVVIVVGVSLAGAETPADDAELEARAIYQATGVKGGLVVHVGCGDGRLTASLLDGDGYLVHGLERDAERVRRAREHIRTRGRYGKVSVERWRGSRLPYADQVVNLLVVESPGLVSERERRRVLCPGGVSYIRRGDVWQPSVKPWPEDIDEWTHFLHGPDNNAVSSDSVVGPPHHLKWSSGPRWARGHEVLASVSAVVSAGGRIFYIADEGPIASVHLPSRWVLAGRDAFNGVLLWKRQIPRWTSRLRPFRSGPMHLPRRLVAVGEEVYVTLGLGAPLVALDAATGVVERTYAATEGTEEVVAHGGTLYLVVGTPEAQEEAAAAQAARRRGQSIPPRDRTILAVDARSGELRWRKSDSHTSDLCSQTLAVGKGRLVFQNTRSLLCLDASSGAFLWSAHLPSTPGRPAWSAPTLVVHDEVVISGDRPGPQEAVDADKPQTAKRSVKPAGGGAPQGRLVAFALKSGDRLWSSDCREGFTSPVDVLIADGLLWTGDLVTAQDPGITQARDPLTGEVKRTRPPDSEFFTPGMSHHRCYRNRATSRFILLGRSGVEFLDLKTGGASANHWIRGTCQFGVLPANGLLYVPPDSCACYVKTKLTGLNALAPRHEAQVGPAGELPQLERGPAYGAMSALESQAAVAVDGDWPTYRRDGARSGATKIAVGAQLHRRWTVQVGGSLTSVTVGGDLLFVARRDDHSVQALEVDSGRPRWSFSAGGRIDSPPTCYRGLVLFGSADGHLYCLRATDGELLWRFRADLEDRRIVIDEGLESLWPIHGSVLVHHGIVYFAAGRSSFLDGGIHLLGLDPFTGKVVAQSRFSGRDPHTGEQPSSAVQGFDMPSGLPDVLSTDGTCLYMRELKFDAQCVEQKDGGSHLFSPTGFLDDSWWHRTYWLLAPRYQSGWHNWHRGGNEFPSGRLLVFDRDSVYGFGRNVYPKRNSGQWRTGEYYRLFAAERDLKPPSSRPEGKRRRPYPQNRVHYRWSRKIDLEVRALVLAAGTLFVAGPRGEAHESLRAFKGQEGIRLQAISATDGEVLSSFELDSLPVFDGLVAAGGRLYLATRDGAVSCFSGS